MRASKDELTKWLDNENGTISGVVWGDMHAEYDVYKKRFDYTPLLKGLPNDRDPCPHWGVVVKGQIRIIYDGKEEIARAGDAYYAPPGHTSVYEAGTEVWEFSPKDELEKTIEVVMRNFEATSKK